MLEVFNDNLIPGLIDLRDRNIPDNKEVITHVYNRITYPFKTPSLQDTLRCVELPPKRVRVMIIGQDPYPTCGAATGLAFSINRQVGPRGAGKSVYKIAREVYRSMGYAIPEIISGNLDHWQAQGVMLINSALTTKIGDPGSHIGYWRSCVRGIVFDYIQSNRDIVVVCLGTRAKDLVKNIEINNILYQQHPNAPGSNIYGSDVFLKVNELIGEPPIDWRFMEEVSSTF